MLIWFTLINVLNLHGENLGCYIIVLDQVGLSDQVVESVWCDS